jgi:hypothetical protein
LLLREHIGLHLRLRSLAFRPASLIPHTLILQPPAPPCTTLQDATITRKNSPARNVHRLLNTLNFIAGIFENLAKGMGLKVCTCVRVWVHVWMDIREGVVEPRDGDRTLSGLRA